MNKTVNINLAGTFFHIDEDAFLKLQRYLESIKRSFTDSQGRSEIISDIEARIAELFNERLQNNRQVIGNKEVDEVITIMGQPEDYIVDDEIFEDEPQTHYHTKTSTSKKLFRDTENSYVGGVASGLAHYFGIDVIWIRLIWVLLMFGAGTGFFIYILLWILVPEAKTTAEKIMMTGEPVNISNIEKKIKDGFDTVSETVSSVAKNVSDAAKKVDFNKQGNIIKSSSKTFFDTLAEIIMFFFKLVTKFIGCILIFIGAATLIALIIGMFSLGIADFIHIPGIDFADIVNAGNSPVWLISLFVFFAIGIPFFFVFYLGLKILVNNLKSIGNIAKFTLLGLWLISCIGLVIIGVREASEHAFNERVIEKETLNITATDTLIVKMLDNDLFRNTYRQDGFKIVNNDKGEKTFYRSNVRILVNTTTDTIATIAIEKNADGSNYDKAINRAKNINYTYNINAKTLLLDSYLSFATTNKFSDQEVLITLYLPVGSVVKFNTNTKTYLNTSSHQNNIVALNNVNHYLKITEDGVLCNSCEETNFEVHVDTPRVKINSNGIDIKNDANHIKINHKGIKANTESVKVNIDSNGISIESDN